MPEEMQTGQPVVENQPQPQTGADEGFEVVKEYMQKINKALTEFIELWKEYNQKFATIEKSLAEISQKVEQTEEVTKSIEEIRKEVFDVKKMFEDYVEALKKRDAKLGSADKGKFEVEGAKEVGGMNIVSQKEVEATTPNAEIGNIKKSADDVSETPRPGTDVEKSIPELDGIDVIKAIREGKMTVSQYYEMLMRERR